MCRAKELFTAVTLLQVALAIKWDVFSTKTLYQWSHNASSVSDNMSTVVVNQDICDAVHVNIINRHGARNPTSGSIKRINNLYTKLVNHKAADKFTFLDQWTSRYDLLTQGELVPAGAEEAEVLGSKFGKYFNKLFNNASRQFEFVSSTKQRTIDSASNFYRGFASMTGTSSQFTNQVNNSLMRFYSGCMKYENMVVDNMTNFVQFEEFGTRPEFRDVEAAVGQRLGLNVTLTPGELYTIYNLCAYETYIYNDTTWCGLMTDAERAVLEYGMDVQNYFESLYGNPLNEEVACPLARDVFRTIDNTIAALSIHGSAGVQSSYVAGKFQFGHSETLAKLLAYLGMFKDSPGLMATNMAAEADRKFRSSHVLPYASNMAFVLYDCGAKLGQSHDFKVKVFVNEVAKGIPACGDELVCDYQTLRQAFSRRIAACDQSQFCSEQLGPIVG